MKVAKGGRFVVVEASARGVMNLGPGAGEEVFLVPFICGLLEVEVVDLEAFLSLLKGEIAGSELEGVFLSIVIV